MLYDLILKNAQEWYRSDKCTVKPLIDHIQRNGNLREAQTQALLVYLYLKIAGANKPLATLFNEGFFSQREDLSALNINQKARDIFEKNTAARALFALSRTPLNNNGNGKKNQTTLFPDLERYIIQNPAAIDYHALSKKLFYSVEYPDYLFSLPMGAGKTFLMAAIIYLDLYFALNEPDNPAFAHNFLILAPSGLKSSIIPSLKTIEHFDPSWVLPEPAAGNIKRMIKFEVLDQPKSARKSNKARNPNAQKVANHQPFDTLMGLVLVVNAEKVILDRVNLLFKKDEDEKDRFANELRNIIGKIPNLQVHIDEVHHAATDDIKLRQVVNKWSANGSINSVLGFSGTPYLGKAEAVKISAGIEIKFTQITNTVFYYPLTEAVRKFLKKPRVEQTSGLSSIEIIEKGLSDFLTTFGDTVYENGCIAKCAVYCGNIERLEEEIYPHLTGKMKIKPEEILKYHKGNKRYKIRKEAETEFNSIDTSLSKKKVILLVQVGKEGWDCRSLTGVILSQKGDCPNNMVLQTSCRCLRQVDKGKHETALIWLNEDNAKTLDKQLKEEQHTSIREITTIGKEGQLNQVPCFSRMDYLKLPKIDFYQLHVEYETIVTVEEAKTRDNISAIDTQEHFDTAVVIERGLSPDDLKKKNLLESVEGEQADFSSWIFTIARESMGVLTRRDLLLFEPGLTRIFNEVTMERQGTRYYNALFRQDEIRSRLRLAFHKHRELNVKSEIIPQNAGLLVIKNLQPMVEEHDKLYPVASDVNEIMQADKTGKGIAQLQKEVEEAQLKLQEFIKSQPNPDLFALAGLSTQKPKSFSPAVVNKAASFHYLPYDFSQSRFELTFLQEVLSLKSFHERKLEIYYNGDRHLTEFRIVCYAGKNQRWQRIGLYTPDFLIIKRKDGGIHKVLIVETKGSGFAEQSEFIARRHFMETEFLKMNNEKFDYNRFEFLYLPDDRKMDENLFSFQTRIATFFEENK
ncbi:MAG: DEAD/DEAH box helicase family protein [Candidatus Aminicenantes bacterium]|nr:DEAD/DEAH box helicase family protein [Candidatus Aminicenantes bacterium]